MFNESDIHRVQGLTHRVEYGGGGEGSYMRIQPPVSFGANFVKYLLKKDGLDVSRFDVQVQSATPSNKEDGGGTLIWVEVNSGSSLLTPEESKRRLDALARCIIDFADASASIEGFLRFLNEDPEE